MTNSLKDALLKAGLSSSKSANARKASKGRSQKQSEKHQRTRTFCEVCKLDHGDVEYYKHKNPVIDAEWICLSCADKNMIDDEYRTTRQSELSKKRSFKRFYGKTKVFPSHTHSHQRPPSKAKTSKAPIRRRPKKPTKSV